MRKWTVRVEDEVADTFGAFCDRNGVSLQSMLETFALVCGEIDTQNGNAPVDVWKPTVTADPTAERWRYMVGRARQADAAKRRPNHPTND